MYSRQVAPMACIFLPWDDLGQRHNRGLDQLLDHDGGGAERRALRRRTERELMTRRVRRLRLLKLGARDFLLSFTIFMALFSIPAEGQRHWAPPHASATDLAVVEKLEPPYGVVVNVGTAVAVPRPAGVIGRAERTRAMILLGLTFSLMLTFNLAIFRHLRRVYASPRRRVWRRVR